MKTTKNARLRELLQRPGILPVPGCHDGITARLVEKVGFDACYMGGNATMSSSFGFPDIGLGTATEMVSRASAIAARIDIPLICDCDTGYGDKINLWRAVRDYEAAGVSGIHIEDQKSPKKCGSMDGVEVVQLSEACDKLEMACKARNDPDFVIIGRTDAYKSTCLDEVIKRCRAFGEAGADLVMPTCVHKPEEMRRLTTEVDNVPVLVDICEFSPLEAGYSDQKLEDLGFKVILRPLTSVLHATVTFERLYRHYKEHGSMEKYFLDGELASQAYYQDLLGFQFFERLKQPR